MSGTRRVPLARHPTVQITAEAVELFEAMSKLKCSCAPPSPTRSPCPGCAKWYDLHEQLHTALGCELWQWPCIARQSPKRAGSTCMNDEIAARMVMLKEAAKARRTASPSSEKEESPDVAEPVAGPGTLA
jgi:hypothetical protein